MSTWSFYDLTTGVFTGVSFRARGASPEDLAANTPAGCGAMVGGDFNPARQKVDVATGQVVAYQPPPPVDDQWQTWAWSEEQGVWLSTPTDAAVARDVRAKRAHLLAACDWVSLRASDTGEAVPAEWLAYRDALRTVPEQAGFPRDVTWPVAPT